MAYTLVYVNFFVYLCSRFGIDGYCTVDIGRVMYGGWHHWMYRSGFAGDADCVCRFMDSTSDRAGRFQLAGIADMGLCDGGSEHTGLCGAGMGHEDVWRYAMGRMG